MFIVISKFPHMPVTEDQHTGRVLSAPRRFCIIWCAVGDVSAGARGRGGVRLLARAVGAWRVQGGLLGTQGAS